MVAITLTNLRIQQDLVASESLKVTIINSLLQNVDLEELSDVMWSKSLKLPLWKISWLTC